MNSSVLRDFLAFLTVVFIILTLAGGAMMLRFSFHGITVTNCIMKFLVRYLSISSLLVGCIAMPFNLHVLLCNGELSCNIACLARYFFTFIFSNDSLIILSTLCHYRRDLIVKVPFGKVACVTLANRRLIVTVAAAISFFPNLFLSIGYLYLMVTNNTAPCQPDEIHKKTTHYYLGIAEGVKTGLVFGVCFTFIIQDVSKIRKTLAEQASRVGQSSLRGLHTQKVNANIYFAVVFIAMWIPFSIIAVLANYIPPYYYNDAYTIGYTLAYGSFALLPICYALTDGNFKTYVKVAFGFSKGNEQTNRANTIFPLKDMPTLGGGKD
ncbi:uncharacterized protein LOC135696286 [Rhopilema esculentum]|uniref:uncharacterized protein LOC135696286 n=1 Tax=Rhopilema esculentum TaxID=499914 RepID=UPI0031D36177